MRVRKVRAYIFAGLDFVLCDPILLVFQSNLVPQIAFDRLVFCILFAFSFPRQVVLLYQLAID